MKKLNLNSIQKEAVQVLRDLIRIDTTNPPGNELQACQYLKELCAQKGLTSEIISSNEQRGNFMLRYAAANPQYPPLILLSHLDVVAANKAEWDYDPFAGIIDQGWIHGRGTLDTKQLTVMGLYSIFLVAAENFKPQRDIILIATADEEKGGNEGILKLLALKEDLFKEATVISEGGGFPLLSASGLIYLCEAGQKGNFKAKVTFKPLADESPYLPSNQQYLDGFSFIQKLNQQKWNTPQPQITTNLIAKLKQRGLTSDKTLQPLLKAMTQNTISPTILKGGRAEKNVLTLCLDGRILPTVTLKQTEDYLSSLLADSSGQFEILSFSPGFENNNWTQLGTILEQKIQEKFPNSVLYPFISIGGSDGRHLQQSNASVIGFSPVLGDLPFNEVVKMVHGKNEKISIDSLMFGIEILYKSIIEYTKE